MSEQTCLTGGPHYDEYCPGRMWSYCKWCGEERPFYKDPPSDTATHSTFSVIVNFVRTVITLVVVVMVCIAMFLFVAFIQAPPCEV